MLVPNRNYQSPAYRYGFQRQEKDDEIKGSGNSINYKFRMHDPRVGRFFAVDPLFRKYPHNSPYAFSENVVINAVELEGLEKDVLWEAPMYNSLSPEGKKAYNKGQQRTAIIIVSVLTVGAFAELLEARALISLSLTDAAVSGGIVGGVLSGGISMLEGDDSYEVLKNTVGGFASGLILGAGGSTTKQLLSSGFVAGSVDNIINQSIDLLFNKKNKIEIDKIIKSGGVSAFSNKLSNSILKFINKKITLSVNKTISGYNTKAYKDMIKKVVAKENPYIKTSGKEFKKLVNNRINLMIDLTVKQEVQSRIAIEKMMELLSAKTEEKIKKRLDEE